ncbi:MAG: hypothetical protein FD161_4851 [Limisphaerales bacterium]|nr:MAG: hypothetical protein FD161_4851 [Limisphaerales bacterium]TXT44024.1 MAG: hypothetical protein FD140_4914 [Limisphaerales bacterium]
MKRPDKSGKVWLYVVGLLLGLPLCYVLSSGPMVVLTYRKVIPESVMETTYGPLVWLMRETGTREAVEAYVVVWLQLTNTPIP